MIQRNIRTTGKRAKVGVPARLINNPGSIWQGKVIWSLSLRVQYKDVVRPSRLISFLIVRGLGQVVPDQLTLPYFADNFAQATPPIRSPLCRYLDTKEEITGGRVRTVEDDIG